MKGLLIASAAALLAGCGMSRQEVRQTAAVAPAWELCYVAVVGHPNQGVMQDIHAAINARRIDCRQEMPMVQARIAADNARSAQPYPWLGRSCTSVAVAPGMTSLNCFP